jgi:hypothetical protein
MWKDSIPGWTCLAPPQTVPSPPPALPTLIWCHRRRVRIVRPHLVMQKLPGTILALRPRGRMMLQLVLHFPSSPSREASCWHWARSWISFARCSTSDGLSVSAVTDRLSVLRRVTCSYLVQCCRLECIPVFQFIESFLSVSLLITSVCAFLQCLCYACVVFGMKLAFCVVYEALLSTK